MTFDDVRKIALAWPEVEDGSSYGTPALKVRKKMPVRLKEDNDSLVMPGVPLDERGMLVESQPKIFYFTDHYRDYPMVPALQGEARHCRAVAAAALADAGVEGSGEKIRRVSFVGWAKRSVPTYLAQVQMKVGTARSAPLPTLRIFQ